MRKNFTIMEKHALFNFIKRFDAGSTDFSFFTIDSFGLEIWIEAAFGGDVRVAAGD